MALLKNHKQLFPFFTLLIILLPAIFIRFYELSLYDFNPDDAYNITMYSHTSISKMWADNLVRNAHPPLGILPGMALFQLVDFFDYKPGFRLISVIPGIIMVPLAFIMGYRLGGVRYALFPALLMAFGFAGVSLSSAVRDYTMLICCELAGLIFLLRWLQENKLRDLYWYYLFMAAAVFINYPPALAMAGTGTAIIIAKIFENKGRFDRAKIKTLAHLTIPHLIIAAAIIAYLLAQKPHETYNIGYAEYAYPRKLKEYLRNVFLLVDYFAGGKTSNAFSALVLVLMVAGTVIMARAKKYTLLMISFLPLAAALITNMAGFYPFSTSRHNFYLAPFLSVPAAFGLVFFIELAAKIPGMKKISGVSLIILAVFCAGIFIHIKNNSFYRMPFLEFPRSKDSYLGGREELELNLFNRTVPGDIMIINGWMANYLVYQVGIDNVKYLPKNIQSIKYQNTDIFFRGFTDNKFTDSPKNFREIRTIVGEAKKYLGHTPERVWFFNPSTLWKSAITQAQQFDGDLRTMMPFMKQKVLTETLSYYVIDYSDLEKLTGTKK